MRSSSPNTVDLVRRRRPHLGTLVEVAAETVAHLQAAFAVIARVHGLMSFQDPASELSRINATAPGEWTPCGPWTGEVVERALFWTHRSGGAFTPVVGRAHASAPFAELAQGRVRRLVAQPIDLSGIAKGYAVDRAVEAMRRAGAGRGLVNAGGDMRGFGACTWPAIVIEPATRSAAVEITLNDRALATSTPFGDSAWSSASVVAPSAMDADALAKVVLHASPPVASACLDHIGAEALTLGPRGWQALERAV